MNDEREERLRLLAAQIAEVERKATNDGSVLAGSQEIGRSIGGVAARGEQITAARGICLRLLSFAPRPRAGLAQAMRRKEVPADIAEDVLDWLTKVGLIDDVAYAHSFVRTKHRDRALSRTALRSELRRLGVDDESMAGAVETVDFDAEQVRAAELIAKRVDAAMVVGPLGAKRRLLGLLARRGYSAAIAVPTVDQAIDRYQTGAEYRPPTSSDAF